MRLSKEGHVHLITEKVVGYTESRKAGFFSMRIRTIYAREILDSRGSPTVEVEVELTNGTRGRAAVPSGASTGRKEALELRDGNRRYGGKGVLKALKNIRDEIAPAIVGRNLSPQGEVDHILIELDGTPNKSRLGANAILGVSLACARAVAKSLQRPLFQFFSLGRTAMLPTPLVNVLNGGVHADNGLDIQEFMLVPVGFSSFREALRAAAETFHTLKKLLQQRGLSTAVGDEGGFAPQLQKNEEALRFLVEAIAEAGYESGHDLAIAIDAAASTFYRGGHYFFEGKTLSSADMIALYEGWLEEFPIVSIEDGLAEDDWPAWKELTGRLGAKAQLVGDDIFVTNTMLIEAGIREQVANAVLIKPNQIGTLTETLQAIETARAGGYRTIISHRSGETEDTFIADLAVGTAAGQIKAGSVSRGERTAKYNRLLRLEERFALELACPFGGIQ